MVIAYITCRNSKEAQKITMHLIKRKLIACANIFPIKSIYRWKGKIVEGDESAIIAKTTIKNFKRVEFEVIKVHSYDTPCILKINGTTNNEYDKWLGKEISEK